MTPRIEVCQQKRLVGKRLNMSFANYRVSELWKGFGPRRKEITNTLTDDLISLVVYSPTHFTDFNPTNEFERWAAVEVTDYGQVPDGLETFDMQGGLYAVFNYKGLSDDASVFTYIFEEWLPASDYVLDDRPHFEILGTTYQNNDPNSEEEIWIPIKPR